MNKINELIIASNNKHKIVEIKQILGDFFQNIYSLEDKGIEVEIEETGTTFIENAIIKAQYISKLTGLPALSDDSGLQVNALGGAPGVFSARYAGEHGDSAKNNAKLLEQMKNVKNRSANFTSAIAISFPNGKTLTAEGKTYGSILTEYSGQGGFGYDPLFFSDDLQKSFGVASSEEKNSVSHRGRALQKMKDILSNM